MADASQKNDEFDKVMAEADTADVEEEEQREAWAKQRKDAGYSERNFDLTVPVEKKRGDEKRERFVCAWCEKPFPIDINGDRAEFDTGNGVVFVKYEQMLAVCKQCIGEKRMADEVYQAEYRPEWIVDEWYDQKLFSSQEKLRTGENPLEELDPAWAHKGDPNDSLKLDFERAAKDPQYKRMNNKNSKLEFVKKKLMRHE